MMKKFSFRGLILLLACLLLLSGCIQPLTDDPASTTVTAPLIQNLPEPEDLHVYTDTVYTYGTPVDQSILATGLSDAYLVLANKSTTLAESYVPNDLVSLTCATDGDGQKLESRAAQALYAMMAEMVADGVTDVYVTSSYRSYQKQMSLYNTYMNKEMSEISPEAYACLGSAYIKEHYLDKEKTQLNAADARRVVLSYSAYPGTSEHQTGLCVDVTTTSIGESLTTAFENTAAFEWLSQNAYRFGFILRYPKDKVEITGYTYEPWHYRFVGREAATDIYYSGLCLEEYLTAIEE